MKLLKTKPSRVFSAVTLSSAVNCFPSRRRLDLVAGLADLFRPGA